mmetsp:Transcript_4965/g.10532  ORF Transcript_4965/g.10532 Transcript_4965/m.10532 type:complete len:253 (+) Transcript_4965:570-1328(+)
MFICSLTQPSQGIAIFGNHQNMSRCGWIDVLESQDMVCFLDHSRWNITADNFIKQSFWFFVAPPSSQDIIPSTRFFPTCEPFHHLIVDFCKGRVLCSNCVEPPCHFGWEGRIDVKFWHDIADGNTSREQGSIRQGNFCTTKVNAIILFVNLIFNHVQLSRKFLNSFFSCSINAKGPFGLVQTSLNGGQVNIMQTANQVGLWIFRLKRRPRIGVFRHDIAGDRVGFCQIEAGILANHGRHFPLRIDFQIFFRS